MPETTFSPRQLVTDFYNALSAADTETIVRAIENRFAENAAIEWPPSLPHGGRIEGARRLRGVFSASANPDAPAGAKNLRLVNAIGDGDEVVAWITFDWLQPGSAAPVANQALELWRFTDGQVQEIRAFYWDTDAISAPQPA
ncbi:ketosteroid isomerase-like protein [Mycolicibacterium sp. BK556]|uniref:nuclear transport factor 2 family protein n=1 Tax=Mycobacteriaceae TaxID=1762 RepID=UPI00105B6025|nr:MULTISPECIES: nuclear transport factor 2 family protein [Mycobacteriaceae]MBB3600652.1 ketosteroid isomerase-like protein [Mycolicibacterium sp. BK556]MBB3630405.1 ketosteroid isomerase-like protein [Mycolicibacterium sp. BK607]MBB3748404.1 ketosteroid isomerase-like protein [Mycolicibacterium sp. BK634]TDO10192.1 ketosteroid isomerase-like protein [Mycobacterium sp. BK086]